MANVVEESPSRELAMARTDELAGENMALVNDSGFFGDWNMTSNPTPTVISYVK